MSPMRLLLYVVLAVFITVGIVAIFSPADTSNGAQRLVHDDVGCPDLRSFKTIGQIASTHDEAATESFMAEHGCRPFQEGEQAYLQEASLASFAGCLRPVGEPQCYWLPDRDFVPAR